jgi:hypothetical protein
MEQPRGWQHIKLGDAVDAGADDGVDWSDPDALVSLLDVAVLTELADWPCEPT